MRGQQQRIAVRIMLEGKSQVFFLKYILETDGSGWNIHSVSNAPLAGQASTTLTFLQGGLGSIDKQKMAKVTESKEFDSEVLPW